jgi:hypothetical protein
MFAGGIGVPTFGKILKNTDMSTVSQTIQEINLQNALAEMKDFFKTCPKLINKVRPYVEEELKLIDSQLDKKGLNDLLTFAQELFDQDHE